MIFNNNLQPLLSILIEKRDPYVSLNYLSFLISGGVGFVDG